MKNRLTALQKEMTRTAPSNKGSNQTPYMFSKNEVVISFKDGVNQNAVTDYSLGVLKDVLKAAKLSKATISDTERTPAEQAAIMYRNLENKGAEHQLKLYGPTGDSVINVYSKLKAEEKTRAQIIAAMEKTIIEKGKSKVSSHMKDFSEVNVIDIAPSSITDHDAFGKALKAETRISKFHLYPADTSYHVEIPQNPVVAQSIRELSDRLNGSGFYDDLSVIDLSYDSESFEADQGNEMATDALSELSEFLSMDDREQSEEMGSFVLKNNEYVYDDGDKPSLRSSRSSGPKDYIDTGRGGSGKEQFAKLKDDADLASDRVDRVLEREETADNGNKAVLAQEALDFDSLEDESTAPVSAQSKDEDDFAKDLQAILSGEKVYDAESKDMVERQPEQVTLDGEDKAPAAAPAPAKDKEETNEDPHSVFDQISDNRAQQASAFKTGTEEEYINFELLDGEPPLTESLSKTQVVNIEVLEKPVFDSDDNGFIPQRASHVSGELRASSVSEMLQKVLGHLKPGQKIGTLTISGHGAKGDISIGAGTSSQPGLIINGNRRLWKPHLEKLKPKFSSHGELFLRGCHVGAGTAGSHKLKEVADVVGVKVKAPTGYVYSNREEQGSVHQVAMPGQPAPVPIKTPTEIMAEKKRSMAKAAGDSLFSHLESVHFYTGDYVGNDINPDQATVTKSDPFWLNLFQTDLSVESADIVKGLSGKVNGVLFLKTSTAVDQYKVFADFNFLVSSDWSTVYSIGYGLRDALIPVFNPDLALNSSDEIVEDLGTKTEIDITVIDHNNDGYLGGTALFTLGELRASSIKDMVDKILAKLGTGQKIRKLTIVGHGNKGIIVMGSAKKLKSKQYINSNEAEWKPELSRLKGKFSANGEVFLRGCNTGAGAKGSAKLKKIADIIGVKVSAPTGKVYPLSEESGSKHQVAHPGKPAPTPIATPSEVKKSKLSKAKALSPMNVDSIKKISIHPSGVDEMPGDSNQFLLQEEDASFIKSFVEGIEFGQKEDASKLASIIDAEVHLQSAQGVKVYQVFNNFDLIAVGDDWSNAYSISHDLKSMLMEALGLEDDGINQSPANS